MALSLHAYHTTTEIAAGLGWPFPGHSHGVWQHGVIHRPDGILIRVTLDKRWIQTKYHYADCFLGPDLFLWKSQLETTLSSQKGKDYSDSRGRPLHLFARRRKRTSNAPAPFRYLGLLSPVSVRGGQPITVVWRLQTPVPMGLWSELLVPGSANPSPGAPDAAYALSAADAEGAALIGEVADLADAGDYRVDDHWSLAKRRAATALFRATVLARDEHSCCVCGLGDARLLDAAHILSWREHPEHRLDPANGLALCVLHHRAWDRGLMEIGPAGDVRLAPDASPTLVRANGLRNRLKLAGATQRYLRKRLR